MFAGYSAYADANQKVVVVNPGHSLGYDSGAGSAYKCEAQVNQEVAGRVVRILNRLGYKVYITHTTDTELASQRLLSQADGSSLRTVGEAVNNVHPDLCIAIHHNSGGATSSGYELYWSSYRSFDNSGVYEAPNMWSGGGSAYRDTTPCGVATASYQFAEYLRKSMEGIPNLSYRYTVERDDYLPAHVNAPCVLYEGGYLSNPTEAAYLASDQYQDQAANRIAAAINDFLGGSGFINDTEMPVFHNIYTSATETSAMDFSVACNVTDDSGIASVQFATWTENNGQDDLIWQQGVDNGNGNFSTVVSSKDHNYETGNYITHVYAYDLSGKFVGVAAPTVTLKPTSGLKTGLSVEKLTSNMAVAYANNLGGNGYRFAVWSENNDQDDLIWTEGERQLGNCFRTIINRADHNNDRGKYFVHCYTMNNEFVGANEIDFGEIKNDGIKSEVVGSKLSASVKNVRTPDSIQQCLFAVWSDENGQDDLTWYQANSDGNNYSIDLDLNNHPGSGIFNVHIYVLDIYGNMQMVGMTSVDYSKNGPAVSITDSNMPKVSVGTLQGNTFKVDITGVPNGYNVLVPVWSEANGQDDLIWHPAANLGNGNFQATIDVGTHKDSGQYNVHVYLQASDSTLTGVCANTIDIPASALNTQVTANTPIMGVSNVTAQQLANMYTDRSPVAFPDYYIARGVSLGQFTQMYVDEARAENVRADIAFAQAMLETAYLKYGGDVSISQFNFAGLGATGNGVRGEDFAAKYGDNANGIRMGIRAQIQHLKAYASTDPLAQECVDSRFGYVSRGKATTIAGLSGTWAADTNYASKIVTIANYIK